MRLHFDYATGGGFELIVFLEDGERCNRIAKIVRSAVERRRMGLHMDADLVDALARQRARNQAHFVETLRNRSLVGVSGDVGDLINHGSLTATTSNETPSDG